MTPQEVKLWNWLREGLVPVGFHFRRQVSIDRFIVDFACLRARLVIEIDGEQHGRDLRQKVADSERDLTLAKMRYRVLRFTNDDVNRHKDVVLDTIIAALRDGDPDPSPLGEGRVAPQERTGVGGAPNVAQAAPPPPGSAPPSPPSPKGEGSTRCANGAD